MVECKEGEEWECVEEEGTKVSKTGVLRKRTNKLMLRWLHYYNSILSATLIINIELGLKGLSK